MTNPAERPRSVLDLKLLTPARVALGRAGSSLPIKAQLQFTLDHARARDAVHAKFDPAALMLGLAELGLQACEVRSRAADRSEYLRRPDLGRRLDQTSRERLASYSTGTAQLAVVIGDGLSAAAVQAHAIGVLRHLLPALAASEVRIGIVVVGSGARVALGDEIGAILSAQMVLMLIGERPGLSAPDSLGAYLTFAPKIGRNDAERNCVSNIHRAGLTYKEAALKIAWLVREGLARRITGVKLKDESGDRFWEPAALGSTERDKSPS
jgi:ethanolamine ammonia-lyase small subunit